MNYDELVQIGLRDVVRNILLSVQHEGFTNNHHLYVTFRTDFPGVRMPEYLREQHPHDITIVLQYQFWNLEVFDDCFCVTLSFNNQREDLEIPLNAVLGLVDPSVKFGLQLTPSEHVGGNSENVASVKEATQEEENMPRIEDGSNVITLDAFRKGKQKGTKRG